MSTWDKSRFAHLPSEWAPPDFAAGEVWIVGAGPGDVGLLTLHALYGLRNAEVILHDSLIPPPILALVEKGKLEYVGKRAHASAHASSKQARKQKDISDRLIMHARAGKRVLRLKGGDPAIFSRGGEEAEALAQAGIPFRVIAGVTAAFASALAAGVVLTHREVNQALTLLTGHQAEGLDWEHLANDKHVLVIYMAMAQQEIAQNLIDAGRDPQTPVILVSHASLPTQQIIYTVLDRLGETVSPPPTTIIIGAHRRWGMDRKQ